MRVRLLLAAVVSIIGAPPLFGQALPAGSIAGVASGSMWSVVGNITPLEKGNVIYATGASQGFNVLEHGPFSITPYVAAGATLDTAGHEWNNQIIGSLGIRLNATVPHGVVSVGTAYTYDVRLRSHMTAKAPGFFVQDWFGWQLPAKYKRYPGSTWAAYGTSSPIEGNNKLLYAFVQQGLVTCKCNGYPLVPFLEVTTARDSQHLDWNNFIRPAAGAKIVMPHGVELGSSFIHEMRRISNTQANGFAMFLKMDADWILAGRH